MNVDPPETASYPPTGSTGSLVAETGIEGTVNVALSTTVADHLIDLQAPKRPWRQPRFIGILALCLLAHAGMLYVLLRDRNLDPRLQAEEQEIPVEIVVEPPPPKKPDPPPAPKVDQQPIRNTLDEKPAFDAPRAATDEKIDREAPDEVSQAPKVAPPSEPAASAAAPTKSAGPPASAAPETAPQPPTQVLTENNPDAEPAAKVPPKPENPKEKATPAETKSQPGKADKSMADLLAGFEPLPDYKIGRAARQTPVSGGKAESTYLSILFGMIMPHLLVPPRLRGALAEGVVSFNVDGTGHLTYQAVTRSSGYLDLDAAAVAAVRQASPFPTPPSGLPLALRFTFSNK